MGNWAVIAEYHDGQSFRTEFICEGQQTKGQALAALHAAVHTYRPSKHIIEQRRRVYRFTDPESYLVVIKGKLTEWQCRLRLAELISDSDADSDSDSDSTDTIGEPQDRIPPGY